MTGLTSRNANGATLPAGPIMTAAALLCVVAFSTGAAEPPTLDAPASGPRSSPFYEDLRHDRHDIIELHDGSLHRGRLLAETITIVCEYGTIELPLDECRWLTFDDPVFGADCVCTTRSNRITGIISNRRLVFQPAFAGQRREFHKADIQTIWLSRARQTGSNARGAETTTVFEMANGDLLTGRLLLNSLTLSTPNGPVMLEVANTGGLTVTYDGQVHPWNQEVTGRPTLEAFSIALESGVRLDDVHWRDVSMVWLRRSREQVARLAGLELPQSRRADETAGGQDPPEVIVNSIGMRLRYVPPGEFQMGSPADARYRAGDERQHAVRLSAGFYIGVTEVTQAQWQAVMGYNPSTFKGALRPVESISWYEALEFCLALSQVEGRTYRLPTEAEWEYACRAGIQEPFNTGGALWRSQANCDGAGPAVDWFSTQRGKSGHRQETTAVGSFPPNRWGLFDMHGNVREWCADWYAAAYPVGTVVDPAGPPRGHMRVQRGGSWRDMPSECRSASRQRGNPGFSNSMTGLRVVFDPDGSPTAAKQLATGPSEVPLASPLLLADWVKSECVDAGLDYEQCIEKFKRKFPRIWDRYGELLERIIAEELGERPPGE